MAWWTQVHCPLALFIILPFRCNTSTSENYNHCIRTMEVQSHCVIYYFTIICKWKTKRKEHRNSKFDSVCWLVVVLILFYIVCGNRFGCLYCNCNANTSRNKNMEGIMTEIYHSTELPHNAVRAYYFVDAVVDMLEYGSAHRTAFTSKF